MARVSLVFLVVAAFAVSVNANDGLDFIQSVSVATFQCLKTAGISFVIPRIYTSVGNLDATGLANIKNAHTAGIATIDAYLFPCVGSTRCVAAATQVYTVLQKLKTESTTIGTLWLDVERLNWPADHATNRKFIEDMVAEAKTLGQTVGIYSNYYNWEEIVGLDYTAQSALPLWWAEYDGVKAFDKYKAFGGWTKPTIHQYHGTETGPCSVSVDLNYKP